MRAMLTLALTAMLTLPASGAERAADEISRERPVPVVPGQGVLLTGSGTALAARETAGPDTFALFGGPDESIEGKFQLANGVTPDWGGGTGSTYTGAPGQWTPVDRTKNTTFWHRSQFNAQTLGTDQPVPNHAMWSGVEAGDPRAENWASPPGYGNLWSDPLTYRSVPVADPFAGQTVALDFYFHHDMETQYDFFRVEYDSAGFWVKVFEIDGTNKDLSGVFPAPGVQFSSVQTKSITYAGNDYGGAGGDQVIIRMVVVTDGIWSDEDGLYDSDAGAVQVDDVTLTMSEGTFTEDFETVPLPGERYLFHPEQGSFVGDFAEMYPFITDLDPCYENITPLAGFVDTGQIIRNGPGPDGTTQIVGGSTSPGITYGVPGNYVVNYNGGLSFGERALWNEIWSPDILWDVPGTEDDDIAVSGALLRWTIWTDLPLLNGMFYVWHVRSALPGEPYGGWEDRRFIYFADGIPQWANYTEDVTDLLQLNPERVQIALGVVDYADEFQFPGSAATPAPFFDNVAFYRYRISGPAFAVRSIDLAQDGFPVSGSLDASTPAARDALDVPFDMAADVNTGPLYNVAGDSIVADVETVITGTTLTDVRMVWALKTNPVFEDALRAAPSGVKDINVQPGPAGTTWTGETMGAASTAPSGVTIANRYFFELPDEDFMYPGDVLHYFLRATDSDGRVSTMPADTTGFHDFSRDTNYDRTFTVRALPSIRDIDTGTQPRLLVWNDFGRRGGEDEWLQVLRAMGLTEGEQFDTYTTQGPSSLVSNGLGSAGVHGATADQLTGYEHIFYFAGDLSTGLLSNGSEDGANDKSDDIGLLQQWHDLPGTRNMAYFGDNIASALSTSSAEGIAYLVDPMGVSFADDDVRDVIGGQVAPRVVPNAQGIYANYFYTDYVVYGGCPGINRFDQIAPVAGADAAHLFTDVSGVPIPPSFNGPAASVLNPHGNGYDMTFPYAFFSIRDPQSRRFPVSSRARLLLEILDWFGFPPWCPGHPWCDDAPPAPVPVELSVAPNPFNPWTTVKFTALEGSKGSVKVYNLRGELVRTLHSGEFRVTEFTWDGKDHKGASVASGVYVVRAEADGKRFNAKVALVK